MKITCTYTADIISAERTVFDYLVALRALEAILVQLNSGAVESRLKELLADRPEALSPQVVADCQKALTRIHNKLKRRISEDGTMKLRHKLTWPLKKQETQESIQLLQQYRDTFHAALTSDIMAVAIKTREEVRRAKESAHAKNISDWLSPFDIEPVLQAVSDIRHPGTSQWVFEDSEFKKWVSGTADVLWCHGDPGSGKTVLSGALFDHLAQTSTVACYFCDHQLGEQQTPEEVLRIDETACASKARINPRPVIGLRGGIQEFSSSSPH